MSTLEHTLASWLPRQRWYAGKGRDVAAVSVESLAVLVDGDPRLELFLARVEVPGAPTETYQLPLSLRRERAPDLEGHLVGAVDLDGPDGAGESVAAYDAVHERDLAGAFLRLVDAEAKVDGVRFARGSEPLRTDLPARPIGAEQSNSSLVYGSDYILKLFRRLSPGVNPDLEVTRALAAVGCRPIIAPLGWIETDLDGEPTTLAMLQPYLRTATDGWALATTSVRDLFAEGDLHADEVGGDFAGEAHRLGTATAVVHRDLARALPSAVAGPQESERTAAQLVSRLEAALTVVPDLDRFEDDLRSVYAEVARWPDPVPVQRVHGDYHLGQVLRTDGGWVLFDFEGEPNRSMAERTALMSPLRDVAGMLRSFDYAGRHLLADHPGEQGLGYRAAEWTERNSHAFCDGYAVGSGRDPRDDRVLLRAFELDKAVYEVVYEARHRPSWLPIPLSAVERLAGAR